MWLSTKDGTDLEDALKDTYQNLLIELWTLREIRHAIEILDRKKIRPALGSPSHDL